MTEKYERLEDLHVRKVVVYGKAVDHKLYKEEEYENQVSEKELQNWFVKGMLLIHSVNNEVVSYEEAIKLVGNNVYTVVAGESALSLQAWSALAAE